MSDQYSLGSLARLIRSHAERYHMPELVPLSAGDAFERVAVSGTSDDVVTLARLSIELVAVIDQQALRYLADLATALIVDDPDE